jgi:non-specific serine/threonine protein kinase
MEEISFGFWLRKQRRALDLSRQAFAGQVGCAEVTLRRIEAGTLKPSKELANIILERLGIDEIARPGWISFARGISSLPGFSPPSTKKPNSNLPAQLTTFVGREKEQSEVISLITKHRLVTLSGSGGVGKTRLSIKVGELVLGTYADGVWLVELASLSNSALIAQTFAVQFGLTAQSTIPFTDLLINFLRSRSILLMVDNCEHLLDACAHFIETLLKNCPHLKILASSREPLGIMGEAIYLVPSLEVPDLQQLIDTFRDFESVHLFEERAQLNRFDFSITLENAGSVAEICQRLDGIPLAIELAAAKVGMLSTEQIAKQLDESFNILTGGSRTALPRHQTLRASMNWSWGLLTEAEQKLMRQLSVFAGGWTLEAAQAVCDGNVQELTHSLVRKSLVVIDQERYHFHETVRQYAHEKLIEADEEENTQDKHLRYFLKLSEQIKRGLVGPQQLDWRRRTNDEFNNLRVSLEYALRANVEAGLYIASRLGQFWPDFDSQEEMCWLDAFIQKPESKKYPHARAKALCEQSGFLFIFEQYKEAQNAAEAALELFRTIGDRYGQVDSLISLGQIFILGSVADPVKGVELAEQALTSAQSLGDNLRQARALDVLGWDHRDFKRAFIYWKEATTLYRQVGHWEGLAHNLSTLGYFLLMDGQLSAAQKCLDEANSLFQQLNIQRRSHLLSGLGQIALIDGDYEQARACFHENARINNELGSRIDYLWAMSHLGLVELRAGNIIGARQIFAESSQGFQKDRSKIGVVFTLEGMSSLFIVIGKARVAARLVGWADATRREIGDTRPRLEQVDIEKLIDACGAKMGKEEFSKAYEDGRKLTLDQAIAYALEEM